MSTNHRPEPIVFRAPERLLVVPERGALCEGTTNRLPVLVRVQAPPMPRLVEVTRAPQALAVVIDRSGSMAGAPLQEALACAADIAGRLAAQDRFALVTFDDQARVALPPTSPAERARVHAALAGVEDGGSSNLFDGWVAGARLLAGLPAAFGLRRVVLLSDGRANVGVTDLESIRNACGELAAQRVTTSTCGLGRHFNEALLVAMARSGGGNHYYGETAFDLYEPFTRELELIAASWARRPRLRIRSAGGTAVRLLNDYPQSQPAPDTLEIALPDIAHGSEAWAVLVLDVTASTPGVDGDGRGPSSCRLLEASLVAEGADGRTVAIAPTTLSLPVLPRAASAALATDPLVARRLAELQAAQLLDLVRDAACERRWGTVQALLAEAQHRFAGNRWVSGILEHIERLARQRDEQRVAKEALFSRRAISTRLAAPEEAGGIATAAEVPSFLRRKTAQGRAALRRDG